MGFFPKSFVRMTSAAFMLCVLLVWVWMAGCQSAAVPTLSPPANTQPGIAGNQRPSFSFLVPDRTTSVSAGALFTIIWVDSDPDDNALIDLVLDPDSNHDSGNELLLLADHPEDGDLITDDSLQIDTSAIPVGNYILRAIISDGNNAPVLVEAPGTLNIVQVGTAPLNNPPTVQVTQPAFNRSVANEDSLLIRWQDQDPDDNALVVITFDRDDNPNNDNPLNLLPSQGIAIHQTLEDDPDGQIPGAEVDSFELVVDVTDIPVREDGLPYFVKVTLIDGNNSPVSAYAPGVVHVLSLVQPKLGTNQQIPDPVDLGLVGTVLSGATFQGFSPGSWLGSTARTLSDFDADGADDFTLVARFGTPQNIAPTGQAYIIYGLPPVVGSNSTRGERFGGRISVNEVSNSVSGVLVQAPHDALQSFDNVLTGGENEGITDVSFLRDVTGDNRPEIIFGLPHTAGVLQSRDDDPGDSADSRPITLTDSFNTLGVLDSHTLSGNGSDMAANCQATRLRVGPSADNAAVVQFDLLPQIFNEIANTLLFGGEIDTAELQLTLPRTDAELDVQVVGFLSDPQYLGPCSGLPVELFGEGQALTATDFQTTVDMADFVEAALLTMAFQGNVPLSLIFEIRPDPTQDFAQIGPANFIEILSTEGGGTFFAPTLELVIGAGDADVIPGCYLDEFSNNFSSSESNDPALVEFGMHSVPDRLGCAIMLNSSNRDNAGIINPDRFESTAINLEDVGQEPVFRGIVAASDVLLEGDGRIGGSRISAGIYDWFDEIFTNSFNQGPLRGQFGMTVDVIPDMSNDQVDEIIISAPNNERDWVDLIATVGFDATHFQTRTVFGSIQVYIGTDFSAIGEDSPSGRRGDDSNSVVPWIRTSSAQCGDNSQDPFRDLLEISGFEVFAEDIDDHLGYARFAGDYDIDGVPDIAMGAPMADPNGVSNAGTAYLLFGTPDAEGMTDGAIFLSNLDTPAIRPPAIRIMGERPNDHLGGIQGLQQDFDGNGVDDMLLASGDYDWGGAPDSGAVAILLGGFLNQTDADADYMFNEIGSSQLPGLVFFGTTAGDKAGGGTLSFGGVDLPAMHGATGSGFYTRQPNAAGPPHSIVTTGADFNGDGFGDVLIAAPGASGFKNSVPRKGVVYLIFGRPNPWDNLTASNNHFSLDLVGTSALPGVVFVSPFQTGTADEAAPFSVAFIGDINTDSFSDIMIGNPLADFRSQINPAASRLDTGEAYIIYGSNFGCNRLHNPLIPEGPNNPANECGFDQ